MITIRLAEDDRTSLGAPEVLRIDPQRLRLKEARSLEVHTGMTVEQLSTGLKAAELDALAALVWLALGRAGITVAYEDLDFDIGGVEVEVGEAPAPASTGS